MKEKDFRKDFFVYIVESPSSEDIYDGRAEGSVLSEILALIGLKAYCKTVVDVNAFEKAFRDDIFFAIEEYDTLLPIIHISGHGDDKGFVLTDGTYFTWDKLKPFLTKINSKINNQLILCMSSCKGLNAIDAVFDKAEPYPFWALVGNISTPTWGETSIGFASFYHILNKRKSLEIAVNGMNCATNQGFFSSLKSEEMRNSRNE